MALNRALNAKLVVLLVIAGWPFAHSASSAEVAPSSRIASVNLCADQLLLALAPAERIAALGPFSKDPQISFLAGRARAFRQLTGRSEELLQLDADVVAVGPFDNKFMRATLRRSRITEIVVDRWASLADVRRGVRAFAHQIGEAAAGDALLEDMDRGLSSLRGVEGRAPPASFVLLHRRGLVGERGIVTEILEVAGLQDAAKSMPETFMSVEAVLSLRPTFLVVSESGSKATDRGLELLEHPALRRLYPRSRRITAPDRLTICAGPSTPTLILHLKNELEGVNRGP